MAAQLSLSSYSHSPMLSRRLSLSPPHTPISLPLSFSLSPHTRSLSFAPPLCPLIRHSQLNASSSSSSIESEEKKPNFVLIFFKGVSMLIAWCFLVATFTFFHCAGQHRYNRLVDEGYITGVWAPVKESEDAEAKREMQELVTREVLRILEEDAKKKKTEVAEEKAEVTEENNEVVKGKGDN